MWKNINYVSSESCTEDVYKKDIVAAGIVNKPECNISSIESR